MKPLNTLEAVYDFFREAESSCTGVRAEMVRRMMIDQCMYSGIQWMNRYGPQATQHTSANYLNILPVNWNPDHQTLRVTTNRIAKYIQKCQAATFPDQIEIDITPPARGSGVPGTVAAQVMEAAVNVGVEVSSVHRAWMNANFMRSVTGAWCIGLNIRTTLVTMKLGSGNATVYDQAMRAYDFDFTRLTLDPFMLNRELTEHDYVINTEIWTAEKARRVLGIEIDEKDLRTIGNLAPYYQDLNRISNSRLYSQYVTQSQSKGVRIHQMHVRTDDGRFGKMYLLLETAPGNLKLLNEANTDTPFGGIGMPFMVLTGHRAADGYGYVSDVFMLHDDQMKLNLAESIKFRHMQRYAGPQTHVDIRSMPSGKSEEAFSAAFNNQIGGVVFYNGRNRDQNVEPPRIVATPPPSPFIQEMVRHYEEKMEQQVHRSPGNFGQTQTHTPASSFMRALEEGDEVLGQRVHEDLDRGNQFFKTMLGTVIKLAKAGSPDILGAMREYGMDEEDLFVVITADENNPPCQLAIRESSIRYRSQVAKRNDLDKALQFQAITGRDYRIANASLSTPITPADQVYYVEAQKAAYAVLMGAQWEAAPYGQYSSFFVEAFRTAMLDKRAKADPQTQQRLKQAIISQIQADAAEQAMIQAIMQMGQPQPQQPQQPAPAPPQPQDLTGVLAGIQSGVDAQASNLAGVA